jgi:NADPH-dependent 2,4-dienoyl-CoA reductase/sulfur reductase-like enzyme
MRSKSAEHIHIKRDPTMKAQIAIIGAGPAGVTAAQAAPNAGARVTLIGAEPAPLVA